MTNLISGKEALIALANGEEVELQVLGDMAWHDTTQWTVGELLCFKGKFRLKPKTITINNIEVPKPFVPKVGETYWCFSTQTVLGYGHNVYVSDYDDKRFINMGAWRTEYEIKQVVAALRSVFKTD